MVFFTFNVFLYFCYQVRLLFYKREVTELISYLPVVDTLFLLQPCFMRDAFSELMLIFYEHLNKVHE